MVEGLLEGRIDVAVANGVCRGTLSARIMALLVEMLI
jgi:hypothetical protein